MNIKSFGWRNPPLGQIERIEIGFQECGAMVNTVRCPDFIYCHDSSKYAEAINYKKNIAPDAKLLLKVLDIPNHISDFNYQKLKEDLMCADAILANSITVQKDIKKILNLDSFVVFDAVQDVNYNTIYKKEIDFFALGRLNSPEKRFYLIKGLFKILKMNNDTSRIFVCCGPENPNIGPFWFNVVSNEILNQLYNSSKFTLCVSKQEGLLLPLLESCICGSIPIVCNDMSTCEELAPKEFVCEPNVESIYNKILTLEQNYDQNHKLSLKYGEEFKNRFNKKQIAKNIIEVFKNF